MAGRHAECSPRHYLNSHRGARERRETGDCLESPCAQGQGWTGEKRLRAELRLRQTGPSPGIPQASLVNTKNLLEQFRHSSHQLSHFQRFLPVSFRLLSYPPGLPTHHQQAQLRTRRKSTGRNLSRPQNKHSDPCSFLKDLGGKDFSRASSPHARGEQVLSLWRR